MNFQIKFINKLSEFLFTKNIKTFTADEDADTLIVKKALEHCEQNENVVIVAEDTDIMVILLALSSYDNIYLLHPASSKKSEKWYNIKEIQTSMNANVLKNVLFLHAFTGCDTTIIPI